MENLAMSDDDMPTPIDPSPEGGPQGEYAVGYRKPPAAHRFKPGTSGNLRGRKKGSRNRKVIMREVLFEPITVREGGITRQMPALEAVVKKALSKALGGDAKATFQIIGLAQREGLLGAAEEQVVDELPEGDFAILNDVMKRLEAAKSAAPEASTQGTRCPDPTKTGGG